MRNVESMSKRSGQPPSWSAQNRPQHNFVSAGRRSHDDSDYSCSLDSLVPPPKSNRNGISLGGNFSDSNKHAELEQRILRLEQTFQLHGGFQNSSSSQGYPGPVVSESDVADAPRPASHNAEQQQTAVWAAPRAPVGRGTTRQYVRPKDFSSMLSEQQSSSEDKSRANNGGMGSRFHSQQPRGDNGGSGGAAAASSAAVAKGGARGRWYELKSPGFTDEFRGYMAVACTPTRSPAPHFAPQ
jgi:hypothetical protein